MNLPNGSNTQSNCRSNSRIWSRILFSVPSARTNKSLNAFQISTHCKHSRVYLGLRGLGRIFSPFTSYWNQPSHMTPHRHRQSSQLMQPFAKTHTQQDVNSEPVLHVFLNTPKRNICVLEDNLSVNTFTESFCISFKSTLKRMHYQPSWCITSAGKREARGCCEPTVRGGCFMVR